MPAAANKTQPTRASVASFLADVSNEARRADAKRIDKILRAITGEKPVMWGPTIIGYGKYRYKYESGREGEMCRLGFSPRGANLVLYVLTGERDQKALLAKLGKHKTGKSCLYINKLSDVDEAVLTDIIRGAWAHMHAKYPNP